MLTRRRSEEQSNAEHHRARRVLWLAEERKSLLAGEICCGAMERALLDSMSYLLVRVAKAHRGLVAEGLAELGLHTGQEPATASVDNLLVSEG